MRLKGSICYHRALSNAELKINRRKARASNGLVQENEETQGSAVQGTA
jgi:hypothetical protein